MSAEGPLRPAPAELLACAPAELVASPPAELVASPPVAALAGDLDEDECSDDCGAAATSASEDSSEARGEGGSARPQALAGRAVWPPHWGLTRQQLVELLQKLRQDPDWRRANNVYTLVSDFIVPWSRGKGLGYALQVNGREPKEVNVMVSHAFAENAEDFLESVIRSTDGDDVVFICALAIYQAEDGAGPTIAEQLGRKPSESPFWRVLAHIKQSGEERGRHWKAVRALQHLPVVLVLAGVLVGCVPIILYKDAFGEWYQRRHADPLYHHQTTTELPNPVVNWWCYRAFPSSIVLVAIAAMIRAALGMTHVVYPGRMLVVPNEQMDLYSRLWCVYEIFIATTMGLPTKMAPTVARAGRAKCESASCSSEEDSNRIRGEIEAREGGYELVDRAIRQVMRGARWHTAGSWIKYAILQIMPVLAYVYMQLGSAALTVLPLVLAGYAFCACLCIWYIKRIRGRFQLDFVVFLLILLFMLGVIMLHVCGYQTGLYSRVAWMPWLDSVLTEFATALIVPLLLLRGPRSSLTSWRPAMITVLFAFLFSARMIIWKPLYSGRFVWTSCFFRAWKITTPLYMLWTEALHFGIEAYAIDDQPKATAAVSSAILGLWLLRSSDIDILIWWLVA